MKILIIGGSSILGTSILQGLKNELYAIHYSYLKNQPPFSNGHKLDITKKNDVLKVIDEIKPDLVIHTSALTNIDLCEKNNSLAYSINVDGTRNIIQACEKANCKIIFVSTSFVFDGLKNEYTEDDKTSPATYYGFTKWKGEEYVKAAKVPYLILRTDALYGWVEKWQRDNSVTRALKFLRSGKILKEITDWYNTPTYLPDFVTAIIKLIKLNKTGVYHLTGSNFISRLEWSKEVADVFGLNLNNIVPVLSKELEHISVKRVNINLLNNKIKNDTGTSFKTTRQGAISMLNTDVNSY